MHFYNSRKKVPWFWKKSSLLDCISGLNSHLKCNFKNILEKNHHVRLWKCPYSKKPPLPWKLLVASLYILKLYLYKYTDQRICRVIFDWSYCFFLQNMFLLIVFCTFWTTPPLPPPPPLLLPLFQCTEFAKSNVCYTFSPH